MEGVGDAKAKAGGREGREEEGERERGKRKKGGNREGERGKGAEGRGKESRGGKVEGAINGTAVGTYDKSSPVTAGKLKSTDGVYGIRFSHNTDAIVTGFTMTKP